MCISEFHFRLINLKAQSAQGIKGVSRVFIFRLQELKCVYLGRVCNFYQSTLGLIRCAYQRKVSVTVVSCQIEITVYLNTVHAQFQTRHPQWFTYLIYIITHCSLPLEHVEPDVNCSRCIVFISTCVTRCYMYKLALNLEASLIVDT